MTKILFALTSHSENGKTGFHLAEVTHVHHILANAGLIIDFANIKGGDAPIAPDTLDLDDAQNKAFMDNPDLQRQIKNTLTLDQIICNDYQAIYFPGGYGAMWNFCDNPQLQRIIAKVYDNGRIIAAICHGQAALLNVTLQDGINLIKNKNITCFSDDEEADNNAQDFLPFSLQQKLVAQGANYSKADKFMPHMLNDNRLITGQNPASAELVANEIIRILNQPKHHFRYQDDDEFVTSPRPCC